jgi:hypothetical protein
MASLVVAQHTDLCRQQDEVSAARYVSFVPSGAIAHIRNLRGAIAVSGLGCLTETIAYSQLMSG